MKNILTSLLMIVMSITAIAQVSEIKGHSSSNASSSRSGRVESGNSGGGGFASYFFFDLFFNGMVDWQRSTLDKRGEVPSILSLELYTQAAIQPSSYYVLNPRLRGNWGIFFTDFRVNYLLEEDIGGIKDLRTDDWQIIGLNLVNTSSVTARISTGFMHENFGDNLSFSESVFGLTITSPNQKIGGFAEYRWARDFTTGANPRREFNASFQRKLFDRGTLHGFATAGVQYQRYYSEVDLWGIQGGLALKLY